MAEEEPSDTDRDAAVAARARRTAAVLEALNAVENRLDRSPAKRGQRIADFVTFLMLAAAVLVLGFPLEQPLLLVALLVVGAGATRLIRHVLSYRWRKERDQLVDDLDGTSGGAA